MNKHPIVKNKFSRVESEVERVSKNEKLKERAKVIKTKFKEADQKLEDRFISRLATL